MASRQMQDANPVAVQRLVKVRIVEIAPATSANQRASDSADSTPFTVRRGVNSWASLYKSLHLTQDEIAEALDSQWRAASEQGQVFDLFGPVMLLPQVNDRAADRGPAAVRAQKPVVHQLRVARPLSKADH